MGRTPGRPAEQRGLSGEQAPARAGQHAAASGRLRPPPVSLKKVLQEHSHIRLWLLPRDGRRAEQLRLEL